ncbi:hypothetical protein [Brachybacterium tyrofermentans]|uniref:hypothetical protein n=1 Tax=Brachybacterium tyrofermentans TaxID=47848 RepID=UPI00186776B7|nr:hypothetical protein [Brachybacterium tyrofermentans]
MSDTAAVLVALLGTIGTIGAGAFTAVVQMRKSRRAGVKEKHVQEAATQADPLVGFDRLTEHLASEVSRLQDAESSQKLRAEKLGREVETERTLRWKAIQLARLLYAWIAQQLPGSDPPSVPGELAPYLTIPRKDPNE